MEIEEAEVCERDILFIKKFRNKAVICSLGIQQFNRGVQVNEMRGRMNLRIGRALLGRDIFRFVFPFSQGVSTFINCALRYFDLSTTLALMR